MADGRWTDDQDPGEAGPRSCRVVSEYRSAYLDPLVVRVGGVLTSGSRRSEWPGWIWCTNTSGKSGWVPEAYLERKGGVYLALRDYDATELSVSVGDEVLMGEQQSGWIWCTNRLGKSGWVPAENLEGSS